MNRLAAIIAVAGVVLVVAGAFVARATSRSASARSGSTRHRGRPQAPDGLLATPAGLRYQTTDKEDSFSAALLDLDSFQVDYLSKNLRVQPRKGKRYAFTDPDGNADRLFVFHRDVDRARERLRKGDAPAGQGQDAFAR